MEHTCGTGQQGTTWFRAFLEKMNFKACKAQGLEFKILGFRNQTERRNPQVAFFLLFQNIFHFLANPLFMPIPPLPLLPAADTKETGASLKPLETKTHRKHLGITAQTIPSPLPALTLH